MSVSVRLRLSLLILLEYFVWGAWYVTMGSFLSYSLHSGGREIGLAYGALALGAIASPFLMGLIADRFIAPQKLLGILHLFGAVMLFLITKSHDFKGLYPLLIAYTVSYMPTIALSNTVCFRQMDSPEKDFSAVRIFGTIGWIASGIVLSRAGWEKSSMCFTLASSAAAALGVFCFFLPPDRNTAGGVSVGRQRVFNPEVFTLFRDRSFVVFFVSSILICIPLSFYFSFTNLYLNKLGVSNAASIMSMGQVSELVFLAALPFLFRKAGIKVMMIVAMLAWVVRFLFFSYAGEGTDAGLVLIYAAIILHGICYDFFFVSGQIYTDGKAGAAGKNAAQGLITLATYGLGFLIGSWIGGEVSTFYSHGQTFQWKAIWLVPGLISTFTLLFFMVLFKDRGTRLPAGAVLASGDQQTGLL